MQMEGVIAKGQLVPLVFMQDAAAASQSAAAMNVVEAYGGTTLSTLDVTEYQVPWDFDLVGISIVSSAARTAGTLTVDASKNGSATGLQASLNATNTQRAYKRLPRESKRGVAGDRVGCLLTTDASWAPATADLVVVVWVLVYLDQV